MTMSAFREYGHPYTDVTELKYLGHILTAMDDYWTAVVANLRKDHKKWARISWILVREGEEAHKSGTEFKVVGQDILIFGSETWVETPHIGRMLGRFHHRMACLLTVKQPRRQHNGSWDYPPPPTPLEGGYTGCRD